MHTELVIEGNIWKSAADATIDADTPHVAELPEVVATDQHPADSELQSGEAFLEVNREAEVHMEALLRVAEECAMVGTENIRRST